MKCCGNTRVPQCTNPTSIIRLFTPCATRFFRASSRTIAFAITIHANKTRIVLQKNGSFTAKIDLTLGDFVITRRHSPVPNQELSLLGTLSLGVCRIQRVRFRPSSFYAQIMPELIEKPIKNVFNAKFYLNLSIGGLKSDRLLAQMFFSLGLGPGPNRTFEGGAGESPVGRK
jgi:hypothetical protein